VGKEKGQRGCAKITGLGQNVHRKTVTKGLKGRQGKVYVECGHYRFESARGSTTSDVNANQKVVPWEG